MGRAPCCDKASVKKGPWSPEEDAKLKAYIEEHGTGGNWIALPQKIGLKRCGKSCRLRWLNYLRPNIKHGDFTEQEEHIICSLYISIGSRWSIIAAQLPGRTDNDIKNYWNTKLKKKLLGKRAPSRRSARANQESYQDGSCSNNNTTIATQALSASALERIQLHMRLQGLYNAFTLSNNGASWPKLPIQQTDAIATTTVNVQQPQHLIDQTVDAVVEAEQLNSADASYLHGGFERSRLGFASPAEAEVSNVESLSGYSSGFGLHDELYDFIYNKNGVAGGAQDGIPLPELRCSDGGAVAGDDKLISTWPASCDYGSALQANSILQDYVLGYDQ